MKKLLLPAFLLLGCSVFAQVPNGSFESWNSTAYMEPTGWFTSNFRNIQAMNSICITRVTGYTGYAIRLQTIVSGNDTSEAFTANTTPGCSDPTSWAGGVPYSQQPTALTGQYRYNLPGNDTALLLVVFKNNSAVIGANVIKIKGTGSQSTFTNFSFPLTCAQVPDTMIIAAASSNLMSGIGIQNGSFLELDNLAFTGATQPVPGGNFESWVNKSADVPAGWEGESNENGITKTVSSYSGSYAVRMETMANECGDVHQATISSGHIHSNGPTTGGYPYTGMTDTLCGYYKYTSMGGDSANVMISLSLNGNPIFGMGKRLPAAANYIYFEIPFQASMTPDTIRIDIQSTKWPNSPANIGSVLYIDNLYLKSTLLGISEHKSDGKISLTPNPVHEVMNLSLENNSSLPATMIVYNMLGEPVQTWSMTGNTAAFDASALPAGVYILQVNTAKGITTKKFVKN